MSYMIHVALTAVVRKNSKTTKRKRLADVQSCGGLIHHGRYTGAVEAISKLPWCERVLATRVTEIHIGTWRNGVKS